MKNYKAYFIDLDGTIYRGNRIIEEAPAFISFLRKQKIPYLYLTNNSSMTPEQLAEKVMNLGIDCHPEEFFTSSMACADWMDSNSCGRNVYMVGEEGLKKALLDRRYQFTDVKPDYVVVGIDRSITYEKMEKASLAIQNGAIFISTNSDKAVPTERGLVPGNGAITAAIAAASGVNPKFIGKPEGVFVHLALKKLGVSMKEVLMVGDNLYTDIAAGVHAKVDTLLVYTGFTQPQDLSGAPFQPTYAVAHLLEWVQKYGS